MRCARRALALGFVGVLTLAGCAPDPPPRVEAPPESPVEQPAVDEASEEPVRPDPAEVAAPCAGHEDRVNEAFIEVAAPVVGQVVGDEVELVGCSNVPEATVRWRLVGADGSELADGFTTATCGSGCVGAFRSRIDLTVAPDADAVELHVFWDDVATAGGERGLHEIALDRR